MQNYILAILLTTVGAKAQLSRLEALSMIESGDNDAAIGRAGEVSRFQIMPSVWAHYSGSRAFRDCRVAKAVASRHLTELTTWFHKRAGRPANDFDVYVLWNAGPTYYTKIGFKTSRIHPVVGERARRYVRLCETVPARRIEPAYRTTAPRESTTVAQLGTVNVKPMVTKEPLWPVYEQPVYRVETVPAFALFPSFQTVPQTHSPAVAGLTLGTIILTPGE